MTRPLYFLFANILLATGEESLARELRVVLQNAGYTVRVVKNGAGLLEALRLSPPQLVLLDAALPDTESMALVREFKAEAEPRFIPVIILAEHTDDADFAQAINAGADEVLDKPISNTELLVRVRSMLRLKAITDELHMLNATLEEKVIERTAALEQAHAALRHNEKLSAMGRLAASVAHEINNPLSGILSYIYLIKYELPAELRLSEDLSLIERQVNAIADLVKQLQHFSKPPQQARRPVDLNKIWEDVLALSRKDLEHRKIRFAYTSPPDLPPVLASADQLGEVFMNLVLNARDAMPEGGTLTVQLLPEDDWLAVQVRDTGMGIPPEVQERLFEPFFTTKGEQGTGLGLAICYRIVQEHAGDIAVESVPGEGTTFTVRLPLAQAMDVPEGATSHVH